MTFVYLFIRLNSMIYVTPTQPATPDGAGGPVGHAMTAKNSKSPLARGAGVWYRGRYAKRIRI